MHTWLGTQRHVLEAKAACCAQGEKEVLDAREAEEATAAALKDSEGVLAKEAAAVKAEAEQAGGTPEAAGVKQEQAGPGAATSERATIEQEASTSGRETVPGGLSPCPLASATLKKTAHISHQGKSCCWLAAKIAVATSATRIAQPHPVNS